MDTYELNQLPEGTVIEVPDGVTTAVQVANAFRNGQPGWLINGDTEPVSSQRLPAYGRGWRVRS